MKMLLATNNGKLNTTGLNNEHIYHVKSLAVQGLWRQNLLTTVLYLCSPISLCSLYPSRKLLQRSQTIRVSCITQVGKDLTKEMLQSLTLFFFLRERHFTQSSLQKIAHLFICHMNTLKLITGEKRKEKRWLIWLKQTNISSLNHMWRS